MPISVTTILVYNDTIFGSLWWRYNQVLLYFSIDFSRRMISRTFRIFTSFWLFSRTSELFSIEHIFCFVPVLQRVLRSALFVKLNFLFTELSYIPSSFFVIWATSGSFLPHQNLKKLWKLFVAFLSGCVLRASGPGHEFSNCIRVWTTCPNASS
jgi:hypothetical protein